MESRGAASCLSLSFWDGDQLGSMYRLEWMLTLTLPSMSLLTGWNAIEPNTSNFISNNPLHGRNLAYRTRSSRTQQLQETRS